MKLFVSGLLNIETTVSVRGFPIAYYPIDYPFFGISSNVSGVGYNIAKALTTLKDEVTLVSFLGNDAEADRILAQLRADGIGTEHILPRLQKTPASVVLFDPTGRRQIYCDLKDIQEQSLAPEDFRALLRSCELAALCNINFNRPLIREARRQGVLTATDVHVLRSVEDDYNRDFMENADLLFLSDEALPCPAEDFVRRLYARYGSRVIVVGLGAEGALLFEGRENKMERIPAFTRGPVVNTVGAGDALFSAFLHFYARGMDATAALQRAVVFAGIKIASNGAAEGFCTEDEVIRNL